VRTTRWVDQLQVGDVVLFKSGTRRTVIHAVLKSNRLLAVDFTITRCSWTKRPTTLSRTDLLQRAARRCGRTKLTRLEKQAASDKKKIGSDRDLFCCDVLTTSH